MVTTALEFGLERLYKASSKEVDFVEVPALNFVMLDGTGDPNTSQAYKAALEVLYAISYGLKFALKREQELEYHVHPLEGLWWADDMAEFSVERKVNWKWTMMIAQPDAVTTDRFATVRDDVARKKSLAALSKARLEEFDEGYCAQILHIGPYSAEGPTIARLHAFIREHGYRFDGRRQKHHEIYLGDPRRVAPAKWRTIIRQPMAQPGGNAGPP